MLPAIEWRNDKVILMDQRELPAKEKYLKLNDYRDVSEAIKVLAIRGAPAIGIAAAMAVALAAIKSKAKSSELLLKEVRKASEHIKKSRPTAVNLFWAVDRMNRVLENNSNKSPDEIREILKLEALAIEKEDIETNIKIASYGSFLFNNNDVIMTICNTGALATGGVGTAFGVIKAAYKRLENVSVVACETRPVLQGARLTAWELKKNNIPFRLITDNMAGHMMNVSKIDAVIAGADRIALNGDSANKIGTYQLAVLAAHHKIPFYIAAPVSTIDFSIQNGSLITIEERDPSEVTSVLGRRIAPKEIKVFNPAFDVTPAGLIKGIITEKGAAYYPFAKTISSWKKN
jgi:methylthioribose-1-phosphate isomerase